MLKFAFPEDFGFLEVCVYSNPASTKLHTSFSVLATLETYSCTSWKRASAGWIYKNVFLMFLWPNVCMV